MIPDDSSLSIASQALADSSIVVSLNWITNCTRVNFSTAAWEKACLIKSPAGLNLPLFRLDTSSRSADTSFLERRLAVSYTHLDVYKRQG